MLADDDLLLQDQSSQQQVYFSFITISLNMRAVNAPIQLLPPQNIMTLNRMLKTVLRLLLLKSHKPLVDNLRKIVEDAISNVDLKYVYIRLI